jgi:uncharacterized RDD family membrane protein YckC
VKCPKCGYVGFERSARCRHCGYDFSFAVPVEAVASAPAATAAVAARAGVADEFFSADRADVATSLDRLGFVDFHVPEADVAGPLVDLPLTVPTPSDLFDDSPPPARPPLAVRRAADRPRSRPTTQVVRRSATSLLDVPVPAEAEAAQTAAVALETASLGARAVAGLLDVGLLGAIALVVVYFTVRLSGLTMADVEILPPVPLSAFLLGLAVAYLAAFTACGGQTLGKMALGLRVVAGDGAVPPGAAGLRALAALAGAGVAGLGFLPILFDGDHRGLHDRLAGTRVVRV